MADEFKFEEYKNYLISTDYLGRYEVWGKDGNYIKLGLSTRDKAKEVIDNLKKDTCR